MSHLMSDGRPCGRPDGHNGRHNSIELVERRRQYQRGVNRKLALQSHPCGRAGCDNEARQLPSGKWDRLCAECDREATRQWRAANPGRAQAMERQRNERVRKAVFDHYGWTCQCCGAAERLTIDHIQGGGEAHRKEIGTKGGSGMYRWLIANSLPEGYQTLCMPCNRSKSAGERCRLDHGKKDVTAA